MQQYFTIREAEALLPEVGEAIRDAIQLKSQYEEADSAIQAESHRIFLSGGALVNRAKMEERNRRRDAAAGRLKDAVERIHSFGCEIKDLDIGLIDFRTFYRRQEVYLCWKLGEPAISYWHGLEEGFRGRKVIDDDFRKNHRGSLPA
jgi:hypothetical protein